MEALSKEDRIRKRLIDRMTPREVTPRVCESYLTFTEDASIIIHAEPGKIHILFS